MGIHRQPLTGPHRIVTRLVLSLATACALAPIGAGAAVLPVTTLADLDVADGFCSLREAIVAANTDAAYQDCPAGSGADVAELQLAGTILLVGDLPQITAGLTIRGLGPADSTLDGDGAYRLLDIVDTSAGFGELLRLEGLTLAGGNAGSGGAVLVGTNQFFEVADSLFVANHATLEGGAIHTRNGVHTEIVRSSFVGNTSGSLGGAVATNGGALTVMDSTFAGNIAQGSNGGGLYALNADDFLIRQCTFSDNGSAVDGGGVAMVRSVSGSAARIESSTFYANVADTDDDDIGNGGGISVAGNIDATLVNTIVAGNLDGTTTGVQCPDGHRKLLAAILTEGYNLIGANDCFEANFPVGEPNMNNDFVGSTAGPLDPQLEPLAANGGLGDTHLPLAGSPVIDQGSCPGVVTDQRGFNNPDTDLRVVDDPIVPNFADGCDIGAVELGASARDTLIFSDGFEAGDTSVWSATVP